MSRRCEYLLAALALATAASWARTEEPARPQCDLGFFVRYCGGGATGTAAKCDKPDCCKDCPNDCCKACKEGKCDADCCKTCGCKKTKCDKPDCCKDCPKDCCKACKAGTCKSDCCKTCVCKSKDGKVMVFVIVPQHGVGPIPPAPVCLPSMPMGAPAMCPHPAPVPACTMMPPMMSPPCMTNPNSRLFTVELKSVEGRAGHEEPVSFCPKLNLLEGQQSCICFDDKEAVLGKCINTACATTPRSNGQVQVHITSSGKDHVRLDLDVQQTEIDHPGRDGVQVVTRCLHTARAVKLGKATRLVLDRCADGAPCRWLEVTISEPEVGRTVECLPPPKCCHETCETSAVKEATKDNLWSVLGQLIDCCLPRETWVKGMTLPSGQYLQHPPQYFPPSPAFPLTRELMTRESLLAPLPTPPMPVPPPPAMAMPPCVAQSSPIVCGTAVNSDAGLMGSINPGASSRSTMGTSEQCAMATMPAPATGRFCLKAEGDELHVKVESGAKLSCKELTLHLGGRDPLKLAACSGQVCASCCDVNAKADTLTTNNEDVLVFEGNVRLRYSHDGKCGKVVGSRVEVNVSEGTIKVKP